MEPLLHHERVRCENAAKQLEVIQEELNHFREIAEPAYSGWFHSHFGKRATELRELHSRWLELNHLISQVNAEAFTSGCSHRTAHERIQRARYRMEETTTTQSQQDEDPENTERQARDTDSKKRPHPEAEGDLTPELERLLRREFEEMAGARPRDNRSRRDYDAMFKEFQEHFREEVLGQPRQKRKTPSDQPPRSPQPTKTPRPPNPEESRRKLIYRTLARRLHPDVNPDLSPRELGLWHEVQLAYQSRSIEKLETLLALSESGDSEWMFGSVQSVSRLRTIFSDFNKKIRSTQKELRERKKTPSWEYMRVREDSSGLKELKRRIARELRDADEELRSEIRNLEEEIDLWSRPSRSQRNKLRRPEFSYRRKY